MFATRTPGDAGVKVTSKRQVEIAGPMLVQEFPVIVNSAALAPEMLKL
jgi:hypothetical protein